MTGVFAFDHYDTNADGVLTKVEALKMFQISLGAKVADQENMRT